MHEEMKIPVEQVPVIRKGYLDKFGTSLRGLMNDYQIDADGYLIYVHDVPIETMLAANPALAAMLAKLPQRKWIFTNSSEAHSQRVLTALGIAQFFEGIIDVKAMGYRSKPDSAVYQLALDTLGVPAATSLFVDDSTSNLAAAKALGAGTVLIGTEPTPAADQVIEYVEDLLSVWPALVESGHG
jgi:putative hydrolase of the HAD superfamily